MKVPNIPLYPQGVRSTPPDTRPVGGLGAVRGGEKRRADSKSGLNQCFPNRHCERKRGNPVYMTGLKFWIATLALAMTEIMNNRHLPKPTELPDQNCYID